MQAFLPVVHHAHYVAPLPQGHRFPMNKYGMLKAYLDQLDLPLKFFEPQMALRGWLELAHDPDYVGQVLEQRVPVEIERRIGFPVTQKVARRTRLSSAGTTLAARLALEYGIACNTAGGSHHAHPGYGSGYCVFNDVAVAASVLLAEGLVHRALVIDLDVHQGDGTAAIFQGDARVFTFSMHGEKNFPVRKQASDMDIALADGMGDAAYLDRLGDVLPTLLAAGPDIVFYNAGVDAHEEDRLGRLALSAEGLQNRDQLVFSACRGARVPVVSVVGGGYHHDLNHLAILHGQVIENAVHQLGAVSSVTLA